MAERKVTLVGGTPRRFQIVDKRSTYFIGAFDKKGKLTAVKIGLATRGKHERRLKALQTGCPNMKLKFLLVLDGSLERKFHRDFKKHRTQGEWFRPVKAILSTIEKLVEAQRLIAAIEASEATTGSGPSEHENA